MEFINLFKEDWRKIPQNIRYFFLSGLTLIGLTWVSDHWSGVRYNFFGWDFRGVFFSLGILLIIVGFGIVVAKQIFLYWRLNKLRRRYAISKLNKMFYLVWFNGRLILFDKTDEKNKKSYHIHPAETAEDLGFVGYGINTPLDFEQHRLAKGLVIGKPGDTIYIKVDDYNYMGQINTNH
jgi:hypothetical protein